MIKWLLFGIVLCSVDLEADSPQGEIRFQAAGDSKVWVGQELELHLDLLSTGFSFSGQQFSLPEVRGAFLLQADSFTQFSDR